MSSGLILGRHLSGFFSQYHHKEIKVSHASSYKAQLSWVTKLTLGTFIRLFLRQSCLRCKGWALHPWYEFRMETMQRIVWNKRGLNLNIFPFFLFTSCRITFFLWFSDFIWLNKLFNAIWGLYLQFSKDCEACNLRQNLENNWCKINIGFSQKEEKLLITALLTLWYLNIKNINIALWLDMISDYLPPWFDESKQTFTIIVRTHCPFPLLTRKGKLP